MDAFYPYITRTNTQPADHPIRLILPVLKYERIHADTTTDKKIRVGWQEPKQRQQQPQQDAHQHAGAAQSIEQELHLIPTSHAVTPDADLHVDAEGHLDIYV
jgi:hypothetical protein